MKNQFSLIRSGTMLLFALVLMTSCAPLNSSFESAPTLPVGKLELQGNASRSFYAHDDGVPEIFPTTKNVGVGLGIGVVKNLDIRFRAEALFIQNFKSPDLGVDFSKAGYFSLSPKMSFFKNQCLAVKGYAAFIIPWEGETRTPFLLNDFGGQVLFTPVQKPYFDLTIGCKMGLWAFPSTGLSLGMNFGKNIERLAFRPDVGLIVGPYNKPVFNAGMGCTVVFDGLRSKNKVGR